jgi:hypothetical protein
LVLENRIMGLEQDNSRLRNELATLKKHFGLPTDRPFVDNDADSARTSPSPPPVKPSNLPVHPNKPPPLLMMPQSSGVFPPQTTASAHLNSYFMGGNPHEMSMAVSQRKHDTKAPPSHLPHHLQHQKPYDRMVKREPEEELVMRSVPSATSTPAPKIESGYGDDGYSHYAPVSPPGVGGLSASATAAAAAAHYAATRGESAYLARHNYDGYGANAWQRSPLSSHSSDEASDEPLQLTVHKRSSEDDSHDADSGHEGMANGDSSGSRYSSNGPSSPPQSVLPLKLRHKIPSDVSPPHHPPIGYSAAAVAALAMSGGVYGSPFSNGLTQLSEIALQASPLSLVKKGPQVNGKTPTDPKYLDPKYLERRRRNNEAARKCRENRKNLTRMREVKSEVLESENGKLRGELEELQEEMKKLRDLLDKKRMEKGLPDQDSEQALQDAELSEEQQRRLEELEQEHRHLTQEQRRLEERHQQERRQRMEEEEQSRDTDSLHGDFHGDLNDDTGAEDSKDAD